jgi:hypothetical protein
VAGEGAVKVLIIPEDPTLDRHVLKPVVERIFQEIGKQARVDMLEDPHLTGVDQALNPATIAQIVEDNPMEDLFLVIVDRDCDRFHNSGAAARLEENHRDKLIACLAHQEAEVWMLALHRDEIGVSFREVRAECDPKERFARPFLERMSWSGLVGRGYKRAMRDMAGQWRGLVAVCPEIGDLQQRIREWVEAHG